MDLTTLSLFVMLLASAIGVDTVMHPDSILLDAAVTGKFESVVVDAPTLNGMLVYEVTQICATPSVLAVPEVRANDNQGVGMAIATAANMQSVAVALQSQLGYQPERIKITLMSEDGAIKMMVSGAGPGGRIETPPFQAQLVLRKGESIERLVHRAALLGMSQIDPYVTSLYLVQSHEADGDFSEAEALIKQTTAALPPAKISFDRSLFENLQGIIELLRGNVDTADSFFHRAGLSNPDNAAALLNAGFVDMQLGRYRDAIQHVEPLLTGRQPTDKLLLSTAYMIRGAAMLVTGDAKQADQDVALAVAANPRSAPAYTLWSEVKRAEGDATAADAFHVKALNRAGNVGNYTEVAALYFQLSWKPGQPLTRNQFAIPGMIRFN
jgi:tetratricopeptide (TPR) repeat protein